jgi:hypothetical protein
MVCVPRRYFDGAAWIAGFDVGNLGADLDDDATALVTEEVREIFVGAFDALDFAELRTADAAHFDLHEHLAVAERGQLDFVDEEGLALLDENSGGGFHAVRGAKRAGVGANSRAGCPCHLIAVFMG